ncbi:hypothetical protein CLOM_g24221 [Closterium sp. NIES-68]|nr:hypothetical protein CLOM_g24221 [Closterium sp. NIES-68]GJP59996.1 hypothetical protein CLOP_g17149 [Closterium sp. NIES-67]
MLPAPHSPASVQRQRGDRRRRVPRAPRVVVPRAESPPRGESITPDADYSEDENEHPVTAAGLDHLFRGCTRMESLSLRCLHKQTSLPASFFSLTNLHTLTLNDASALDAPAFANLSSIANLAIDAVLLDDGRLLRLARLPNLVSLAFLDDTQLGEDDGRHAFFSFARLSSLKSLEFEAYGPKPDMLLLSESSCSRLERLLLSHYDCLGRLPDNIDALLPRVRELSARWCNGDLPEQITSLRFLESLTISMCGGVTLLPENFGRLTALKTLVLHGLPLSSLPASLGQLKALQTLLVVDCADLRELPAGFAAGLTSLQNLSLVHSPHVVLPADIGRLTNLQTFLLKRSGAKEPLPTSFTLLSSLARLELDQCMVSELPAAVGQLRRLEELCIQCCPHITALPAAITALTELQVLRVGDCSGLSWVPRDLSRLARLREVELSGCARLTEYPHALPRSLEGLTLGNDQQGSALTGIGAISTLTRLSTLSLKLVTLADGLHDSRNLSRLTRLQHLELAIASDSTELPFPLTCLPHLHSLTIWSAGGMISLPDDVALALKQLRRLSIQRADELQQLPAAITMLHHLTCFQLHAPKLASLPQGMGTLTRLLKLKLSRCSSLSHLPASLTQLACLHELTVQHCSIRSLPSSFARLMRLRDLNLQGCEQLEALPADLPQLKMLRCLTVRGCSRVCEVRGAIQPAGVYGMYGLTLSAL